MLLSLNNKVEVSSSKLSCMFIYDSEGWDHTSIEMDYGRNSDKFLEYSALYDIK